jgi:hypothetical protein
MPQAMLKIADNTFIGATLVTGYFEIKWNIIVWATRLDAIAVNNNALQPTHVAFAKDCH